MQYHNPYNFFDITRIMQLVLLYNDDDDDYLQLSEYNALKPFEKYEIVLN